MSSKEKVNPIVVSKERPIFNWSEFPIGTHAKLYSGRVVKLLKISGDDALWGYGRQSRTWSYKSKVNGWYKPDVKDDEDINPQTVCFPRMKTTEINMLGVPVGTLCFTSDTQLYQFTELHVDKAEDEESNQTKMKWQLVSLQHEEKDLVDGQLRNPKADGREEIFSKQGFGYGQSYREQRSYGDLYYEKVIFPLWEEDRKILDKDRIEQEQTFERLDSMFDFA